MIKSLKIILLLLCLLFPLTAQAQSGADLFPMAVKHQDGLYVLNAMPGSADSAAVIAAATFLNNTPTYNYDAVWSPDGTKLAYTVSAGEGAFSAEKTIMVWDGTQSIEIVTARLNTGFPVSWTRDGLLVYMVMTDNTASDAFGLLTQVYTVAPVAGAQPDLVIDGLPFGVGCGGGSSVPMHWLTWEDSDFGGSRAILALTDYGLVYSAQCVGAKTSLYRPFSGETASLANGQMTRAALSPDEMRVAGIVAETGFEGGQIVVVDLTTLEERTLTTAQPATRVVWGRDGSLYYTAVSVNRNLLESFSPDEMTLVKTVLGYVDTGGTPLVLEANDISLYRIAPDGSETRLAAVYGYAAGRLAVRGDTVFFSTIANGDVWIQAILAGAVTHENNFDVAKQYLSTTVNYVTLNAEGTVAGSGALPGDLRQFAVPR